jgi:hypothetical protein
MRFLLLRTFFSSSKALHPTIVDRCSDRHFSLCLVVGGNSPREFRPFFPRIKIPSTVVNRCSDRHFSLCPVVGGNSPREFHPFFPRIKIPSWMHSELHFSAVNIQRPVLPQKMQNRQHNYHVTDRQRNLIYKFTTSVRLSVGRDGSAF